MKEFAEARDAAGNARQEGKGGLSQEGSGRWQENPERLTHAGVLARQQGDLQRALSLFARAAQSSPTTPELHNNLGVLLEELSRYREAASAYGKALALRPAYWEASCNLGNSLKKMGRGEEAIAAYRAAIAMNPAYADARYNLANSLREEGRWLEAVESYRGLLALKPDHVSGWINLGGTLLALNRLDEAIEAEREALRLSPENPDAHWNLAFPLLASGDFENGWREYEWRLKNPSFPSSFAGREIWDGTPLSGKTLLFRGEQGFGDTLQFFRYLRLLARLELRIVLECRRELLPLLASQSPDIHCFAAGEEPPPFDTFLYLMSLPCLLGTTLSTIPAEVPYIDADQALVRQWQGRMGGEGLLKVGVVWAGSPGYKNDRYRSLPLRLLRPFAEMPQVGLYSLQMGAAAAELGKETWGGRVRDLSGDLHSFADTAALIANLDVVVSVDTAVAHLAGAMGKRVLLMLPASSEWRWLRGRSDSPWYPTLRLFRQEVAGEWERVMGAIAGELAREVLDRQELRMEAAASKVEPATGREAAVGGAEPAVSRGGGDQAGAAVSRGGAVDLNALFRAANELRSQGRGEEAIAAYQRLLEIAPDCAEIHNNLGLALQDRNDLDGAERCYRKAIALKPKLTDAHSNLGTVQVLRGDRESAIGSFRKAIDCRGDYLPAYVNLGATLQYLERQEEALPVYRRAIKLQPAAMAPRINLGNSYQELMQPERAIEVFEEGLRLEPHNPELHWNLALSLLSIGEYRRGWREYEWRFRVEGASDLPSAPGLQSGRTVILKCEQGLGDTLQFVRYAPLVAARGARVLLQCQYPSLKPLLRRVKGVAGVFARGEALPPADSVLPLLSLPSIFGTTLESVPAEIPYLTADPERLALWRSRIPDQDALKVGLVWKGGPLPRNRACPYQAFAPLSALAGARFYSLQLDDSPDQKLLAAVDLSPQMEDFGDTAAILENLDLVITIDTATAHLAGGMGVPVWTLLPHACDWRWMSERGDSPWYPTMRLFRQKRGGDWQGVIDTVAKELSEQIRIKLERVCVSHATGRGEVIKGL